MPITIKNMTKLTDAQVEFGALKGWPHFIAEGRRRGWTILMPGTHHIDHTGQTVAITSIIIGRTPTERRTT